MMTPSKKQMRHSFNSVPETYEHASDWQKSVGNLLLDYLKDIQPQQKTILDLGAGTGYLSRHIHHTYPNNELFIMDIAENMLQFSRQHLNTQQYICADAETIALNNECIDLIVSNMVLHWCQSLSQSLNETNRILKKDGLIIFSIMGPQSLVSLKQAWNKIDKHSHINSFPNEASIKQACHNAGFTIDHFEKHCIQKYYANVYELMNHLKATGAKNISPNKPKGLMGKQKFSTLAKQYKNPLNYEIFTVVCRK